ncbi:hypothetical protein ACN4EG_13205 [Alkalinema pantanalense CENA528]|uniref:hypothetical protein n=1 Tax=Alkalinema pantanalense TaxID=1620705 RepID=UPI003D6E1AEE
MTMRVLPRLVIAGVMVGALLVPLASPARAEKFACDDLVEMANSLDELSNAMESGVEIQQDGPEDQALRSVVDALSDAAKIENNQALHDAVEEMDQAWHAMDRSGFVAAVDRVTMIFDSLRAQDCPAQ